MSSQARKRESPPTSVGSTGCSSLAQYLQSDLGIPTSIILCHHRTIQLSTPSQRPAFLCLLMSRSLPQTPQAHKAIINAAAPSTRQQGEHPTQSSLPFQDSVCSHHIPGTRARTIGIADVNPGPRLFFSDLPNAVVVFTAASPDLTSGFVSIIAPVNPPVHA